MAKFPVKHRPGHDGLEMNLLDLSETDLTNMEVSRKKQVRPVKGGTDISTEGS